MRGLAFIAAVTLLACGRTGLVDDVSPTPGDATPAGSGVRGASAGGLSGAVATSTGGPVATSVGVSSETTSAAGGTGNPARDAGADARPCLDESRPWLLFELDGVDRRTLYAVRSDGTGGHRVPLAHASPIYTSISADGTKVLYVAFEPETDGGYYGTLYLEDLGSRTASVLFASGQPTSYTSLSSDHQTVAYTLGQDLHVIDADGQNDRLVVEADPNSLFGDGHPLFVGATTTLLYGFGQAFGSVKTDGSDNITLVSESSSTFGFPNPAISPDLSSVAAAVECPDDDYETWLRVYSYASLPASCDSGTKIALTSGYSSSPNEAADPSWGPTNLIAYGDGKDIYVVSPHGGTPRNMTAHLTTGEGEAFDPLWAPGCAPIP